MARIINHHKTKFDQVMSSIKGALRYLNVYIGCIVRVHTHVQQQQGQ